MTSRTTRLHEESKRQKELSKKKTTLGVIYPKDYFNPRGFYYAANIFFAAEFDTLTVMEAQQISGIHNQNEKDGYPPWVMDIPVVKLPDGNLYQGTFNAVSSGYSLKNGIFYCILKRHKKKNDNFHLLWNNKKKIAINTCKRLRDVDIPDSIDGMYYSGSFVNNDYTCMGGGPTEIGFRPDYYPNMKVNCKEIYHEYSDDNSDHNNSDHDELLGYDPFEMSENNQIITPPPPAMASSSSTPTATATTTTAPSSLMSNSGTYTTSSGSNLRKRKATNDNNNNNNRHNFKRTQTVSTSSLLSPSSIKEMAGESCRKVWAKNVEVIDDPIDITMSGDSSSNNNDSSKNTEKAFIFYPSESSSSRVCTASLKRQKQQQQQQQQQQNNMLKNRSEKVIRITSSNGRKLLHENPEIENFFDEYTIIKPTLPVVNDENNNNNNDNNNNKCKIHIHFLFHSLFQAYKALEEFHQLFYSSSSSSSSTKKMLFSSSNDTIIITGIYIEIKCFKCGEKKKCECNENENENENENVNNMNPEKMEIENEEKFHHDVSFTSWERAYSFIKILYHHPFFKNNDNNNNNNNNNNIHSTHTTANITIHPLFKMK